MTRALVTNDDGVDSPGIRALAGVAVDAGLDVVVAAPSWDSSGASASFTAVQEDGRFVVDPRHYDELPDVPVVAVSEDLAVITMYRGDSKRPLDPVTRLLSRANQALQVLEKAGLLKVDYGSITVRDLDGLRQFHG